MIHANGRDNNVQKQMMRQLDRRFCLNSCSNVGLCYENFNQSIYTQPLRRIQLNLSSRQTRPAESPCPRPCNRNPRTSSSTPTTFTVRQQYQGWVLTLSHCRALPTHYMTAFRNHALVTNERMAIPLDFTLEFKEFWTAHPRDRVVSSRTDALCTQFTGFSICHSMYDDKHMLKVVQHATAFALNNQVATAIFMLLPNGWKIAPTLSQNLHWQQGCLHYSWKHLKDKSALHATPLPAAKQNTTPARCNMGLRILVVWTKLPGSNLLQTNHPG